MTLPLSLYRAGPDTRHQDQWQTKLEKKQVAKQVKECNLPAKNIQVRRVSIPVNNQKKNPQKLQQHETASWWPFALLEAMPSEGVGFYKIQSFIFGWRSFSKPAFPLSGTVPFRCYKVTRRVFGDYGTVPISENKAKK